MRLLSLAIAMTLTAPATAESLADLYARAVDFDPQLKVAAAQLRISEAGVGLAKAANRPQLNAQAGYSRNSQTLSDNPFLQQSGMDEASFDYNQTTASLTAQQMLYNRATGQRVDQARASYEQARAQWAAAQSQLILRVAQAYFDLLGAQNDVALREAEYQALSQQNEQIRQRFELGAATITDKTEAQARADSARAALLSARHERVAKQEALRLIVGTGDLQVDGLKPALAWGPPQPSDINIWLQKAEAANADLKALQAGVKAAEAGVRAASGQAWPSLALVASHQYVEADDGLFNQGVNETTSVGVQLNVPLFTGGAVRAESRQAAERASQSQDQLLLGRLSLQSQVRTTYQDVESNLSIVQALQQGVVSAQAAYDATVQGHKLGTRTTADVLTAQGALFQAQRDYSNMRSRYVMSQLQLAYLAGELDEQWLARVNAWLDGSDADK